jgi:ribosome-binding protein aMBF1 (putative translation factor)
MQPNLAGCLFPRVLRKPAIQPESARHDPGKSTACHKEAVKQLHQVSYLLLSFSEKGSMARGEKAAEFGIRRLLGKNIRMAREYAGLSQRELSERVQMGQAYLSQCEAGKWNVGVDNIERISRALGILPRDLLDRDFSADRFYKIT